MKSVFIWVGGLILLIAVAAVLLVVRARYAQAKAAVPTNTAVAAKGDIRLVVSSTGSVVSNLDVDIKCKASGQVIKLPHDVSEAVKEGELLMELDPVDEQRQVDIAQAGLDSAVAKLAEAKQSYLIAQNDLATARLKADAGLASAEAKLKDATAKATRMKELLDQKLESQEDYETAQTTADQSAADLKTAQAAEADIKSQELGLDLKKEDIALAQAEVDENKIGVDNFKQQLDYTKVTVPVTELEPGDPPRQWVVSARTIQVGNVISSAITNVSGGSTVMTLSDLSRFFILASVDESDVGTVTVAFNKGIAVPVEITVDAFPGLKFDGKVVRIATTGVNSQNVVTFQVKIEVTSANKNLLKPQMTANVDIIAADKKDVLLVPAQAVTQRKNKSFVNLVKPDGTTEQRDVTIGVSDIAKTEIVSGIKEGDKVVVGKVGQDSKWKGTNPGGPKGGPGGGPPG